jgi:phosphatidylserine/phosphatidylglycerophosphate/cardiolipin synthase-like enzyme
MRARTQKDGIHLQAVAGTYAVRIGWDMSEQDTRGVLGFGIHRTDHTENEAHWLRGMKTFEDTEPDPCPGETFPTCKHPVQGFTWSDYSAKPGYKYTYKVVALRGTPSNLDPGEWAEIDVTTESEDTGAHAVWFNRGAAASQEYARKFNNERPSDAGPRAYTWLSRGLEEALLGFISQAAGPQWGLRVAAYEFTYAPVLKALGQAASGGADVRIIYDARCSDVSKPNRAAVAAEGIKALCTERTSNSSYIAHNKFIVLMKNDDPVAVWTGSTNMTEGGIFGQSNVGHVVRDASLAREYLEYWEKLHEDPDARELRPWVARTTPTPQDGSQPCHGTCAMFSPRSGLELLDWYADEAASAASMLCMTFPFGISKAFDGVFGAPTKGLRYAMLDSVGSQKGAADKVRALRSKPYNLFAVGNYIRHNALDHWLNEKLSGLNKHAMYIHTKYMLINPLGDDPIVISGSANFSDASTRNNDENMLVIRGNTTVADIYVTEYFRLWKHYAYREWHASRDCSEEASLDHLMDTDKWRSDFYRNTYKSRERQLFSGTFGT